VRLRRALAETIVVVDGGATNKTLLLELLERPEVVTGAADTEWLDRLAADGTLLPDRAADAALLAAAIESYHEDEALERQGFYATARRGRPEASHHMGRLIELSCGGQAYAVHVAQSGPRGFRATLDGATVDVEVERLGAFERRLRFSGATHRLVVSNGPDFLIEVGGVAHRVARDEGGLIRAPGPSLVVAVSVAPGDEVDAGSPLVVLESMKMETTVAAPFTGRVTEVLVPGNVQVGAGAPLIRLQREGEGSSAESSAARIALTPPPEVDLAERSQALDALSGIRSLLLGFDVADDEARRLVAEFARHRSQVPADDADLFRAELDALSIFTDIAELSRNRPPPDDLDPAAEGLHSPREHFHSFLRSLDPEREGLPDVLRERLARALGHYGVNSLDRTPELAEAAYRLFLALERSASSRSAVVELLDHRLRQVSALPPDLGEELRATLDRLIPATQLRHPAVAEIARSVRYRYFDQPRIAAERERVYGEARAQLGYLAANPVAADYRERVEALGASREPLLPLLGGAVEGVSHNEPLLEVLTRRYYRVAGLEDVRVVDLDGKPFLTAFYERKGRRVRLISTFADPSTLATSAARAGELVRSGPATEGVAVDLYLSWEDPPSEPDEMARTIADALAAARLPSGVGRVAVSVAHLPGRETSHFTFRRAEEGVREDVLARGLHPMIARRLQLPRFDNFVLSRLPSVEDTYLFRCVAKDDPSDERLVAFAEVRDLTPSDDRSGALTALPEVERVLAGCLEGIRRAQHGVPAERRTGANMVVLYVWPPIEVPVHEVVGVTRKLAPMTAGLGIEQVVLYVRTERPGAGAGPEMALSFAYDPVAGVTVDLSEASAEPVAPIDAYRQRVSAARRRGAAYPYELVRLLTGPDGTFSEHDLDGEGSLVPVERPPGGNAAGIVVGLVTTPTSRVPEGMVRVALLGDPTKSLGSVSEPECSRIMAAIDLAEHLGVPVEWLALSSGAKISRDSGTENMDWVARVLRRIIAFTQAGGEINVIVAGINVGAQPYWNAEATMLMHTKGILIMTPDSAMVLTGKQALEYSGGVSAEDNFGIGGYDRIMGPNGQAQYWAPHLAGACELLFQHYAHTYVQPGERFPRPAPSSDPIDRDVCESPHVVPGSDFRTVGDIFSAETNPERKKPFDIRTLMRAVGDQDHPPLERWPGMSDADTAVVLDAHLGGQPVTLLGIESKPIQRHGFLPADGPDQWTAGTLFPLSSKKAARAINAASGNRPLVVLANLSGFDGSPESLRKRQLEYGAEIGRAVVNFDGPIVFCVVSRYHGGAFVVFSGALNDAMQVLAVEGSYASVIGGAPAAAVVFAGDVRDRTNADPRVAELQQRLSEASDEERPLLREQLAEVVATVRSEKLGEVATEFDAIHSVERAKEVGSVHDIIPAARLRPNLIAAVRRGMARCTGDA
jgi:acetyl-CoA carboxylase carboxyltransferase component/biotin carboxyl carrier protein